MDHFKTRFSLLKAYILSLPFAEGIGAHNSVPEVVPYGSFVNGTFSASSLSDIDVTLLFDSDVKHVSVLEFLIN